MNLKRTFIIASLVLLGMFAQSCILDGEEDDFFNVAQIADPRYTAELEFSYGGNHFYPLKDTVWLRPNESVKFWLHGEGSRLYSLEVSINNEVILQQEQKRDFSISSAGMAEGVYDLTITQYVKSGTGSLADKLDAEMVGYAASFVLMVGDIAFKPAIESIGLIDGTLNLKWSAYTRGDFQAYEIRKYEWDPGFYDTYRKFTITDPAQTSFNDTTYVGGRATYVLYVDRGGKYFTSDDKRINFLYKPNMRLSKIAEGRVRLTWDRPLFYKNMKSLEVRWNQYSNSSVLLGEVLPDQTSLEFDFMATFGRLQNFSLRMTAKAEPPYRAGEVMSSTEALTYGKRTPPFTDVIYNAPEDAYYLAFDKQYYNEYPEAIYRLDNELNITDTLTYSDYFTSYINLIQSPDGNYVYLLHDFRILDLQKNPLAIKESFHTGTYFEGSEHDYAVSNNNFVVYAHRYEVRVLDFTTKKVLISVDRKGSCHLSADGQYFVHDTDLYKFDGTQYQLSMTLPFSDIRLLHFLHDRQQLLVATAEKLVLYDYVSESVVIEYDFPTGLYAYPDFNDRSMEYTVRNNALISLNIDTGEESVVPVYQTYNSMVEGEYLFTNSGFGLKPYLNE